MSVGESVTQAKQWCQEARKILKLGITSKRGRAMKRRAEKVAKELKDLEAAVTKGNIPMSPEDVTSYVEKFKAIATGLSRAATDGNLDQVDLQSNRLSELKAELRVKLASGKDKGKKQGEFDTRLSKDFPAEKSTAEAALNQLKQHGQAAAIAAETTAIKRDKIDAAQGKHDGGKHEEARALLLSVPEACAAARQIADRADAYFKARPAADKQLTDLKKPLNPQQLAAIDVEIKAIETKLASAATKADIGTRKYEDASALLREIPTDCNAARQIAVKCQTYLTDRATAEQELTNLKTPLDATQLAAIDQEIKAIETKLSQAATKAVVSARQYDEASTLVKEIAGDCSKAQAIAVKCQTYKTDRAAAELEFTKLKAPLNAPQLAAIDPEIKAIEAKLTLAATKAEVATRQYDEAITLVNQIAGDCTTAKDLANKFKAYAAALDGGQRRIAALKKHRQQAAINTEITAFEGKLTQAAEKAAADKREYDNALALANEVISGYPAAKDVADKTAEQRKFEKELIDRKEKIKTAAGHDVIATEISNIETRLPDLDTKIKDRDWTEATKIYAEIKGLCNAAEQKAGEHIVYNAARNNALLLVTKLEAHPYKAQITTEIAAIKKEMIGDAKLEFDKGNYNIAMSLLEGAKLDYDVARQKADQHGVSVVYTPARNEVDGLFSALETHAAKDAIVKEIAAIKKQLEQAKKLADISAFTEALAVVAEAKKACESALKVANSQKDFGTAETSAKNLVGNTATAPQPAIEAVQKLLDELKKHTHKLIVKDDIEAIEKKIEAAKKKAA